MGVEGCGEEAGVAGRSGGAEWWGGEVRRSGGVSADRVRHNNNNFFNTFMDISIIFFHVVGDTSGLTYALARGTF